MIDGKNFFGQPVRNDMRTYDDIQKLPIGCLFARLYLFQGTF